MSTPFFNKLYILFLDPYNHLFLYFGSDDIILLTFRTFYHHLIRLSKYREARRPYKKFMIAGLPIFSYPCTSKEERRGSDTVLK